MNPHTKKLAAALTGAVALGSGAFAIGAQMNDGSATASSGPTEDRRSGDRPTDRPCFGDHGPFGLDGVAERLGVEEDELEKALDEIREEQGPVKGDLHEEQLATDLAAALGIDATRVQAALERLLDAGRRDGRFGRGPGRLPGPPLASPGRHGPGPGGLARDLARELDLAPAKVRAAFGSLSTKSSERHEERRAAFTKALAEKLGIPVERVEDAFPEPAGGLPPGPPPHGMVMDAPSGPGSDSGEDRLRRAP